MTGRKGNILCGNWRGLQTLRMGVASPEDRNKTKKRRLPYRPEKEASQMVSLHKIHYIFRWARRDSNPRPHGCEPCALTS